MNRENLRSLPSALYHGITKFFKEFFDKELTYYASSLSFYTIFTVIPLLLIILTIFTSLPSFEGYYGKIKEFIFANLMPSQTEVISGYIDGFLTNSVKMGVMGFVYVLFASMMFFNNYEYIIGKIFNTKPRGFWDSITTYWTLITLIPMTMVLSFYLSGKIQDFLAQNSYTSSINLLEILPYLIIWLLFFVSYKISANIKIANRAALISSFITSLVWYIAKTAFVTYAFYNQTYSSVYGSFSILLFFFLWIYVSWIIFLYGLKLCKMMQASSKNIKSKQKSDN